jgi:hypothetical protein
VRGAGRVRHREIARSHGTHHVDGTVAVNPDFTLGYHIYGDYEPNGGTANAQQILLPAEVVGSKNVGDDSADADYFSVSPQAGQILYVNLLADMIGSAYDGDIYLRDAGGNQLAYVVNWAANLKDPNLSYAVQATGTYYIRLVSRTGTKSSGSSYRLFIMAR